MALGKNMKKVDVIQGENEPENEVGQTEFSADSFPEIDLSLDEVSEMPVIDLSFDIESDIQEESNEIVLDENTEIELPLVEENPVEVIEATTAPTEELSVAPENSVAPSFEDIETETLKVLFKPSRRKTQKRIIIEIEGALNINNIDTLFNKVNDVFETYNQVEVILRNITDVDLTFVQLFHAIRVSYYPFQKYISINAEFSKEDRKLLNACGFTEFQTQVSFEG